jgi:NAD-dependent dihydropyrimidine dehydrogenase PreA subunit
MRQHEHHHGLGGGNGFGSGHGGGGGHNGGRGENGFCVCPQCGYSEPHRAGVPCKTLLCPECNLSLVRSETRGNKTSANSTNKSSTENVKKDIVEKKERKITFPKVDTEKCTGCQECINTCPRDTIVLKDGKAFVINENCSNCRVCMRVCPENAFILE